MCPIHTGRAIGSSASADWLSFATGGDRIIVGTRLMARMQFETLYYAAEVFWHDFWGFVSCVFPPEAMCLLGKETFRCFSVFWGNSSCFFFPTPCRPPV